MARLSEGYMTYLKQILGEEQAARIAADVKDLPEAEAAKLLVNARYNDDVREAARQVGRGIQIRTTAVPVTDVRRGPDKGSE